MTTRGLLLLIGLAFACTRQADPDTSRATTETAPGSDAMAAGGTASTETESPARTAGTGPASFSYGCGDEYRFVAQMMNSDDSVRLLLPDTTLMLPHVVSASGARFSEGEYTYWSKGDEARLEIPGRSFTGCVSDEGGTGWQEAQARGVDFRAIRQEPGWILDIHEGDSITVLADYGESRYRFPSVEPLVDRDAGQTVFRVDAEVHRTTIVIEDEPCRDAMSGWPYEATVSMTVDGREYQGCGRWL
ncbi:MAG: MliC family protein [Gemmatimonadota bacterium]